MSVIVPAYEYVFIKLGYMKKLVMSEKNLEKLREFNQISPLLRFLNPFYPHLSPDSTRMSQIQREILTSYARMLGWIHDHSPVPLRMFLLACMRKQEVANLKMIILASLMGESEKKKRDQMIHAVEEYLGNVELFNALLRATSVDEISFLVRGTRYNEVVREGIHHFRTGRESFMLEAFLDKTFYENLVLTKEQEPGIPSIAKAYLAMQVELYNLQVVSRGIMAGLPTNLMLQLLVPTAYLVGNETLELMIENGTIKGALSLLEGALAKIDVKLGAKIPGKEKSELLERINHLYMEHFMKKYKPIHDDFRYMAFYETIHTIIKKTEEITKYINPALTRVLHGNILFKRE